MRTRTKFEAPEQPQPLTAVEASALPPLQFKAWQQKDLTLIPSPTFVYSDFYALGYTKDLCTIQDFLTVVNFVFFRRSE